MRMVWLEDVFSFNYAIEQSQSGVEIERRQYEHGDKHRDFGLQSVAGDGHIGKKEPKKSASAVPHK